MTTQKVRNNQVFPNYNDPFVYVTPADGTDTGDVQGTPGVIRPSWRQLLQTLWRRVGSGGNTPVQPQTLSTSPFLFTASVPGTMWINGGAGVGVLLTRINVSVPVIAPAGVPMSQGDGIVIVFTSPPTVNFVPT